ncbi:PUX10 [Symbiodinium sp. KB8]|nr:PUX10 [Symbiodinium sp. KB8]
MTERTGGRGPQFLECSSKEAIQRARDQFQLDVLSSAEVAQVLGEHFMVWGADATAPDGYEALQMFQVGSFPYLGVFLHAGANKVQCIWSHEGYMPAAELAAALVAANTQGRPVVEQQRMEEEVRQADRALREEQAARYEATVARDLERQAQREAQEQRESLMEALRESRRLAKEESVAAARARIEASPEPPKPDSRGQLPDGSKVTSIRLQFPDGTKVQRRFPSDAPLRLVRDYALVLLASTGGATPDDVELSTTFPRKTYGADAFGMTLLEAQWHPRVVLFVTGLESTDEGEMQAEAEAVVSGGAGAAAKAGGAGEQQGQEPAASLSEEDLLAGAGS